MSTTPGWHPDPSGRHQHRFWDGATWTEQVADDGVTARDPLPSATLGGEGGRPTDATRPAAGAPSPTAAPQQPAVTSSKAPLFIGVAVIVALLAAGLVFLLTGSDHSSADGGGPGDFTYDVGSERFTVHQVSLVSGEAVAFRASELGTTEVAYGISQADLERVSTIDGIISDPENFTDAYSDSNEAARELFSDFSDLSDEQMALAELLADESGFVALPGFEGVLLERVDYDAFGDFASDESFATEARGSFFIAPTDMVISIIMIADSDERDVKLQVRTEANRDEVTIASSDDYDDLFSEPFYSDVYSEMSSDIRSGGDDSDSGGN